MSMKRTRAKSFGTSRRHDDAPISFNKAAREEPEKSWEEHTEGKPDEAFAAYSMKARYERGALIAHPKFGKGVIVHAEEQRVDVLFADGKRKLGHGLP
jgi:hypothetical protein